ncbi:FAD-binding oxidoreductase, partial [bacterium]|nr:FAD-binding oxidoreductase [bacterium]
MHSYQDENHKIVYSYDSSVVNIKRIYPNKIVFAENKNELVKIVKNANRCDMPLYIRGAGTSVAGSSVPFESGSVISLEKMNGIIDLDEQGKMVTVEPGVTVISLNNFLKKYKLQLPAFPASYKFSTIGGNISTRASGLDAVKYGTIENYVKRLKVITGKGEDLSLGFKTKRYSMGIDLKNLYFGSLGLLGIIYEITLSLVPLENKIYKYEYYADNIKEIIKLIRQIKNKGIIPIKMEIMDNRITKLLLNKNEYY